MAWPVVSIDLTLCNLTPKGKEALGTAMATLATAHHRPSKLMAIRTDEWSVELDDTELDLSNLGRGPQFHASSLQSKVYDLFLPPRHCAITNKTFE